MFEEKIKEIERRIERYEVVQAIIEEAKVHLKELSLEEEQLRKAIAMLEITKKIAKQYLTDKQNNMVNSINAAIVAVDELIDSPSKFRLKLGDGKVDIIAQDGTPLRDAQGSGYRVILSTIVRVLAVLNSSLTKILFLDEPTPQANRKNITYFTSFLQEQGQDMQIFYVCQDAKEFLRGTVMYEVKMIDKQTVVRKAKYDE